MINAPALGKAKKGPGETMNYNTDTARAYNQLRAAIVQYFALEGNAQDRQDAYAIITAHIKRGPLPVPMDADALDEAEADYLATVTHLWQS